jgi:hypothetical protein
MYFKSIYGFIICSLLLILTACSDADKENELIDLFTTASQDLIAIYFPDGTTEDVISINTFVDYKIEGLKSNGVDVIPITENIVWSLSDGAISTIDQNGRLSSGPVAETITITAKVGILTASFDLYVSAAKFDQVIKLNSTPVLVNMCQVQQIKPIGSYINDDGSEEIRPVDNNIINTITWIIRNQEDDSPSQRAFIKTENSITELQALEAGNVIIQAQAMSVYSGNITTSVDINQTLDHNLNSLKLCRSSETDLAACSLISADIAENSVVSLMAIGNYQATDGTTYNQNISAYSKWGIDDNNIATIAFSADRQQLDVTGNTPNSIANITAACGNIEQTFPDSEIENGVVLAVPVTCASGDTNCLSATAAINIYEITITPPLIVTANDVALEDDVVKNLGYSPAKITLKVTAEYSDGSSRDVTTDTNINYDNRSPLIIEETSTPGEYTSTQVNGIADIRIDFEGEVFIAKIEIPIN